MTFVKLSSRIGPNRHRIMLRMVRFVHVTMRTFLLSCGAYVSCTRPSSAKRRRMRTVSDDGGRGKVAVLG